MSYLCAHSDQQAACNVLGSKEDGDARADEHDTFCSHCCPACTAQVLQCHTEHEEEGTATDLPCFISHCLQIVAFCSRISNRQQ